MNRKRKLVTSLTAILLFLALTVSAGQAQGLGPAAPLELGSDFTYQGYLKNASGPVNDTCDFKFSLWDSLSNLTGQIGSTQAKPGVGVSNGMFTISNLDFGPIAFNGDARWLQIAVRCSGDSVYITLAPRQPLTPTPYAMYASVSGSTTTLQGNPVANTAPSSNQVLKWNGAAWSPAADETGGGGGDITAVIAGAGLNGGAMSGDAALNVTFAGNGLAVTVSRSDHQHDATYVNDNAGEVGNPDVPVGALSPDRISGTAWTSTNDGSGTGLDADLLDWLHASSFATSSHNHWSQSWTGSGTGLTLSGGTTGIAGYGSTYGVYGRSTTLAGIGVLGANSTSGVGVAGFQSGYDASIGNGWWGKPAGLFGGTFGVSGVSKYPEGFGVHGQYQATSGGGSGILGENYTSPAGWAGQFFSNGHGVWIGAGGAGKTGLVVQNGSKSAAVRTNDGSRLLYTEESTEVWFTDYGFGKLANGAATITVDPVFAQTVNLKEPYHVFVQAYGDADVYVTNRTPTGFEVRMRDGDPNVEFSFRIVAARLGYEGQRLEPAPWAANDPSLSPDMQGGSKAPAGTLNGKTVP